MHACANMVKKDVRLLVFDIVNKHSEFVFRYLVIPESVPMGLQVENRHH